MEYAKEQQKLSENQENLLKIQQLLDKTASDHFSIQASSLSASSSSSSSLNKMKHNKNADLIPVNENLSAGRYVLSGHLSTSEGLIVMIPDSRIILHDDGTLSGVTLVIRLIYN